MSIPSTGLIRVLSCQSIYEFDGKTWKHVSGVADMADVLNKVLPRVQARHVDALVTAERCLKAAGQSYKIESVQLDKWPVGTKPRPPWVVG